jgi:hypothetical protein
MKRRPSMLIAVLLVVIIAAVYAGSLFLWDYQLDSACREEFGNRELSILSSLDPLKSREGLEFARVLSVGHTAYEANVKTPEELLGVFCNARVLLCRREAGEFRYCQEYEVPFSAETG